MLAEKCRVECSAMQAPPLKRPTSDQDHKGTVFLWQDHWQVLGQLMPNRSHRHISASLLVGLDRPFRLAVDGEWRETRKINSRAVKS